MNEVERWTTPRSARQCEDTLMAAGVPCSRYLTVAEAMAEPQTVARGTMATVEDAAGPFLVPNPPFKFADGSVGAQAAVPLLGQDTRAYSRYPEDGCRPDRPAGRAVRGRCPIGKVAGKGGRFLHLIGQPQRDDRKGDQDDQPQDVRGDEGQHALEDRGESSRPARRS